MTGICGLGFGQKIELDGLEEGGSLINGQPLLPPLDAQGWCILSLLSQQGQLTLMPSKMEGSGVPRYRDSRLPSPRMPGDMVSFEASDKMVLVGDRLSNDPCVQRFCRPAWALGWSKDEVTSKKPLCRARHIGLLIFA